MRSYSVASFGVTIKKTMSNTMLSSNIALKEGLYLTESIYEIDE